MSTEAYNLAILLTLKDSASGGLSRYEARLRAAGKEGENFHKTFEQIKSDLSRDLAIGGVGVAGLVGLKKGIDSAATYEDALFELRKAFQENENASGRSFAEQEKDFNKLVALATEMGGQLAGSSKEYAQIFTALNKSGIDATATINGTGKAVSYLANVTGALRKGTHENLAEDFGSFVKMFSVKGEKELMRMVDMFAAIDDRFNLQSSNLIEGAKYFALTANDAMQLKGFEGAAETMKLMAFMKRFTAREGSIAGTSLDNLIGQYLSHLDKVDRLKKQTGISIDFYDDKGQFKGATPADRVKTLFTELEKMQKLNPMERATWIKAIFGEVGFEAATAISSQGLKGYELINTEMAKSVGVQTQINQQMQTYNAKWEALTGSIENFKASAFTPLMDDVKSLLDTGSSIANTLQKFSAENQGLMGTLGTIALYGSTAMVAYSGVKTLAGGFKLLSLYNKFSKREGLLPYLTGIREEAARTTNVVTGMSKASDSLNKTQIGFIRTSNEAKTTSKEIANATSKAEKFKGTLQGLAGSSAVSIGVQVLGIAAAEFALTTIIQRLSDAAEQSQKLAENSKIVQRTYDELAGRGLTYNKPGDYGGKQDLFDRQATEFLQSINTRELEVALAPERKTWNEFFKDILTPGIVPYPYSNRSSEYFSPDLAAKKWSKAELTQPLHDPNVLARTIVGLYQGSGDTKFNLGQIEKILKAFEMIVGEAKFKAAKDMAQKELGYEKKTETTQPQRSIFELTKPQPLPFIRGMSQFGFQPFSNQLIKPFGERPASPRPFESPQNFGEKKLFDVQKTSQIPLVFQNLVDLKKPIQPLQVDLTNLSGAVSQAQQSILSLGQSDNSGFQIFNQGLQDLVSPIPQASTDIFNLGDKSGKAVSPIDGLALAALRVSGGLNNVGNQLANWKAPMPQVTTYSIGVPAGTTGSPVIGVQPPTKASGGTVLREGLVYVHQGEDIMPADVTRAYRKPQTFAESVGYSPKKNIFQTIENLYKNSSVNDNQSILFNQISNLLNNNIGYHLESFSNRNSFAQNSHSGINSFAVQNLNPAFLPKINLKSERINSHSSDKTSFINPYFERQPNLSIIEESKEREANFESISERERVRESNKSTSQPPTIHFSIEVNVPASANARESKENFLREFRDLKPEFERMMADIFREGSERH